MPPVLYDFWVTPAWDTKQFKHQTKLSKTPCNYVAEFFLSFVSPARREAITLIVNKQAKVKTYGVHVAPIFLPKSFLITRPHVELFMRRTKPSELNSWKGRRLAQLSSSEHVLSVCIRRIKRKLQKRFPGTNVDLHMGRTAVINKKFVWWCIFSLFREKTCYWTLAGRLRLLFGLIQLIGSTRPKFDVWPNRRS